MQGVCSTYIYYGTSLEPRRPDAPSNTQRGKEGLVNMAQQFCTTTELLAAQSDWLMWQSSGFLTTNHLALLITMLQTYSSLFQFTEAQQATSKAYVALQQLVHSVRMSPDSPL